NPLFFSKWFLREELRGSREMVAKRMMEDVKFWSSKGNNINDLMSEFLQKNDQDNIQKLNDYILNTLDMIRWHHQDMFQIPYMQSYAQILGATESTVITFNYDTLIEEKISHMYVSYYKEIIKYGELISPYNLGISKENCLSVYEENFFVDY